MLEKILTKIKNLDISDILSRFQISGKKAIKKNQFQNMDDSDSVIDKKGDNNITKEENKENSVVGNMNENTKETSLDAKGVGKSVSYNWYEDAISRITVQRNLLVVFVFLVLTVLCIVSFAILGITSFKTIEPFVIQISDKTGIVTLVDPVTVKEYSANKAVVESYVVKYIRARELYDVTTYKEDYYKTAPLLSTNLVQSEFSNILKSSDVSSPIIAYSSSRKTDLQIRSIQYFDNNVIQVRFVVKVYGRDMQKPEKEKPRIATLSYNFRDLKISEQDRYINPLGFVITSYKVSDETL